MASSAHDRGTADKKATLATVARTLALVTALTFIVVGIAGFFITGLDQFAEHTDKHLLLFEINPLHNIVHLALGVIGLALWRTTRQAATYGIIVAVGYAGAFVYGLIALDQSWDVLSINAADNALHIGLAALGAVIAGLAYAAMGSRSEASSRSTFESPERGRGAPA